MKPTAVKLLFVLALAIGTSGLPVAAPAVDAPAAPNHGHRDARVRC